MQHYGYLLALLIALSGMVALDRRYKLAWFWDRRKTLVILANALFVFLIWDVVLIRAQIVATNQAWVTGWHIFSPNMPVEELLFLTLLSYQTLLLWRWQCTR